MIRSPPILKKITQWMNCNSAKNSGWTIEGRHCDSFPSTLNVLTWHFSWKWHLFFSSFCLIFPVSALEHNTWFTKLRASSNSSKLNAELCDRILGVVSKSISLQELHLSAIGARWDFAVKLKQALETNPCSSLQILGKYTINYISTLIYGVCVRNK